MRPQHREILIVGAGPAGATAAAMLARAGRDVLLVDQERFPRDKVCGGCVSGRGVGLLQDVVDGTSELPGIVPKAVRFRVGRCDIESRATAASRIVLRRDLDATLADAARCRGAELREGIRVIPPHNGDAPWDVGGTAVRPRWVLLACGVGRMVQAVGIAGHGVRRCLVSQQWIQPPEAGLPPLGYVEMHWLRGGYVGLSTPSAGRCVVATACERVGTNAGGVFEHLRRLNPHAQIMQMLRSDAPRRFGSRGSAGFPWRPTRLGTGRVLLIGDAAGYEEPFTGEGIGLAMLSARLATDAVLRGGAVQAHYARSMHRQHRPVLRRTRWLGRLLRLAVVHRVSRHPRFVPLATFKHLIEHVHLRQPA